MPYLENKIGIHQFISLDGEIVAPAQVKVVDDRYGVDGSEFILTGKKGQPFTLVSSVDCEDYADAVATLNAYKQLIEEGAVEVVQGGVSSDDFGYAVNVLNVNGRPQVLAGIAVGNSFSSGKQGFLTAQWTLVAVPTPAP